MRWCGFAFWRLSNTPSLGFSAPGDRLNSQRHRHCPTQRSGTTSAHPSHWEQCWGPTTRCHGRTASVPTSVLMRQVSARESARSAYRDVRATSVCMICRSQRASSMPISSSVSSPRGFPGRCRDMNSNCFSGHVWKPLKGGNTKILGLLLCTALDGHKYTKGFSCLSIGNFFLLQSFLISFELTRESA